jgi:multidrug resistance efflux pump
MTQRVLIALSFLVMAISIGGYVWQAKKIAVRAPTQMGDSSVALAPTQSPSTKGIGAQAEAPRLIQIDRDQSDPVVPTPIGRAQPSVPVIPIQNPLVQTTPVQTTPVNPLQSALQAPPGAPLNSTQDGVLRYKAILSFVNDIKVVAQTDGIILDILVDEGSLVAKDTTLIQIDNRLANAEKEVAVKELESAKLKAEDDSQIRFSAASYEVASSVFNRSQELYVKGVEPRDDWEKKQLEKIKAGFQIDVSKREQMINQAAVGVSTAKLNASLVQLELRTIKAPFSGVVASMQKERYDWVKAGEEVLRLVSLEKFRVKGTVRITDSPNALEGAKARVLIPVGAGKVEQIDGIVGFVSPESQGTGARNDGTQDYTVWVEIPNRQVDGKYLFRGTMDAVVEITPNR